MTKVMSQEQAMAICNWKLARIDERLTEIKATAPRSDYHMQELRCELRDLEGARRIAESELDELTREPTAKELAMAKRREDVVASFVNTDMVGIRKEAERFEAEGDFRQARVWRKEILGLREYYEARVS